MAARFGIGVSTAIAWIASARAGRLTPAKQGRRGDSRLDAHENFIIGMIEEEKDITLTRWFVTARLLPPVETRSRDVRHVFSDVVNDVS